jgi:hypothetical protein
MKNRLVAFGLMAFSLVANAADIKVEQSATLVKVTSATVKAEGQGFPSYHVTATATFSNSCVAPREGEVFKMVEQKNGFQVLSITLGELVAKRMCPKIFRPVSLTFDLGSYTKPNDGSFDAILVNGQKAVAEQE